MTKIILGNKKCCLFSNFNEIYAYISEKDINEKDDINTLTFKEFLCTPWISVRYFEPYIITNTDIIIPFYVTDTLHKDYIFDDYSNQFKITVEFNGNIITKIVNAGENEINIGSSNIEGEQYFTIKCKDLSTGIESPTSFIDILVKNTFEISESETYYMTEDDLITYGIDNTNNTTESIMVNNIDGINNLIKDVKEKGYKKLVMYNPSGNTDERSVYRVQPYNTRTRAIVVPSDITLDLNNSKLKQHSSLSTVDYGYGTNNTSLLIMTEKDAVNSHLINGCLEGDYDEHDVSKYGEGEGYNISQFGGRFCSMENLEVSYGTGYSICAGQVTQAYRNELGTNVIGTHWTNIYIDKNGNEIPCESCLTSIYVSCVMNGYSYISANNYLGYGGINGSYAEFIHFYDKDKKYIKAYKVRQYGLVRVPEDAIYCRVTLYSKSVASNFKVEFAKSRHLTQCQFKNLNIHDTRTCGMATGIFNRLLVEDCTFARSGYSITPLPIDIEDGYQYAENYFFKNNKITEWASTQTGGLVCTCGYNMVFEGDLSGFNFKIGKVKGLTFYNLENNLKSLQFISYGKDISGFSTLKNLIITGDIETGMAVENDEIIYKNCSFSKSINRNAVSDFAYSKQCIFDNCTFDLTNTFEFTNCKVIGSTIDLKPYSRGFRGVYFYGCTITNTGTSVKSMQLYSRESNFENCNIKNVNIEVVHDIPVTIKNCTLENVKFTGTYKDNIIQENNIII